MIFLIVKDPELAIYKQNKKEARPLVKYCMTDLSVFTNVEKAN